jgi:sugar lactone lactonase YvrE
MFCRDFRRFLVRALLWLTGIAMGGRLCADEYPVLRSNRLAYAIGRVEWDASRNLVYLTDQTSNRVVRVNLETGEETGEVRFTRTPEAVKLSPDGSRLYVATLAMPRTNPAAYHLQNGYLHTINSATFVQTDEMALDIDPYSIAARSNDQVIVRGGRSWDTRIDTYNTRNQTLIGFVAGTMYSTLPHQMTLHTDFTRLYCAESVFLTVYGSPSPSGPFDRTNAVVPSMGTFHIHPDGLRGINGEMQVFGLGTNAFDQPELMGHLEGLVGDELGSFTNLTFDTLNGAFFTASSNKITRFNLATLVRTGTGTANGDIRWLHATADHVYTLILLPGGRDHALFEYPNPAKTDTTNRPPVAAIAMSPGNPTTVDEVRFDAGGSVDGGSADGLRYQWDWNGDDAYDTPWSYDPVAVHRFFTPGSRTVRVRVADASGEMSVAERVVTVIVGVGVDSGVPFTNAVPFVLPFVAQAVAFDPVRPVAYVADIAGRRVVSVDLNTGRGIRSYAYENLPVDIAVSPDGRSLYVALRASSITVNPQGIRSMVSEIDLATGVKKEGFEVALDPLKIIATASGKVVLLPSSAGSGQDTMVYDTGTGTRLFKFYGPFGSEVVPVPERDSLFVFFGGSARLISLTPAADGTAVELAAGTLADERRPFAALAGGTRIVGSSGLSYDLTGPNIVPMPEGGLSGGRRYDFLFADSGNRPALYATLYYSDLLLINSRTRALVGSSRMPARPDLMGQSGGRIFYVQYSSFQGPVTTIGEIENPARGMENNRPPAIAVSVNPEQPVILGQVTFDASGTTDDQDGLRFRWDLDGDGVFEMVWDDDAIVSKTYLAEGNVTVRAEVLDPWGETNRWERVIRVDSVIDPGRTPSFSEAWRLPFYVGDAVFDPVRPNLWATDPAGRRVVRVNLSNGLPEKQWDFPQPPGSLAATPDGRFLYATIPYPQQGIMTYTNYVAEFDLQADVLRRLIPIDGHQGEPTDIAADNDGLLFISTRSSIESHSASDGSFISQFLAVGGRLRISPASRHLYISAYSRSSFRPVLGRIDYRGDGIPGAVAQSTADGVNIANRPILLRGETLLLDGNGTIYTNRPGEADDLQRGGSIGPAYGAVEIPGTGEVLVAGGDRSGYYRAETMEPAQTFRTTCSMQYAGAYAGRHFLVGTSGGSTLISPRIRPGLAGTNIAPVVRWPVAMQGRGFAEDGFVSVEVDADDMDGGVEGVTLYREGAAIANVSSYPFWADLRNLPLGTNFIIAVATDNLGTNGAPSTNAIVITKRPTVVWTRDTPLVLRQGADYTLETRAADPDGTVVRVDYYENFSPPLVPVLAGSATNAPWRITVTNFTRARNFVAVATDNHGVTGSSTDRWVLAAGAAGDDFYNPFELHGSSDTFRASNTHATTQPLEPWIGGTSQRSLWWTWTAPSSGAYRLSTAGSDFDTVLGVYGDSEDIGGLALIAMNNNRLPSIPASAVKFTAIRVARIASRWMEWMAPPETWRFPSSWNRRCRSPCRTTSSNNVL